MLVIGDLILDQDSVLSIAGLPEGDAVRVTVTMKDAAATTHTFHTKPEEWNKIRERCSKR